MASGKSIRAEHKSFFITISFRECVGFGISLGKGTSSTTLVLPSRRIGVKQPSLPDHDCRFSLSTWAAANPNLHSGKSLAATGRIGLAARFESPFPDLLIQTRLAS
ncbi:MAG TPA: hypothetical protein VGF88_00685 [Acidobacteriaceae bacterium]|jgi:hypothetical protein